jgi:cystathionine beta-lyase
VHPFDAVSLEELRKRQSAKWRVYPDDVLPAWVAEMDYPIAAPIKRALRDALAIDDAGYADPRGMGEAFAPWAKATWGWELAPRDVKTAVDVVTAIGELVRVATAPGDRVVIEPPVYPPFAGTVAMLGRTVVEAPLRFGEDGSPEADLAAIERAYAAGAKMHILCSPHNPSGMVPSRATLARIAELAAHHGVLVLADEIHAPMTFREPAPRAPQRLHAPFPTVSAEAARVGVVLTSASKTWNLAGLKASMMIATTDEARAVLAKLPAEMPYHAGQFGIVGARAAFTEGQGWLDDLHAILDRNRRLLAELLREHLPQIRYRMPDAGYLAWLDCRALGLGDDPAKAFLARGKVALSPGPSFGEQGKGFARLNFATTKALLEEAVLRLKRSV